MGSEIYSVITGTGNYIPSKRIKNEDFLSSEFYDFSGSKLESMNEELVQKFKKVTTIEERRYVPEDMVTSDIAYKAALEAIASSRISKEDLDYIIVAHNFGDIKEQ